MTSRDSSTRGGRGHMSQKPDVFLRKVRPSPGISFCVCLLNNQSKKSCSCFAEASILGVRMKEHFLQIHLWVPVFFFRSECNLHCKQGKQYDSFFLPPKTVFPRKIQRLFTLKFQCISPFLPTLFVHPQSCCKKLWTAVCIEISTHTAVFTNSFCPITHKSQVFPASS